MKILEARDWLSGSDDSATASLYTCMFVWVESKDRGYICVCVREKEREKRKGT